MAKFFTYGHSLESINSMCYWDFLDLIDGIAEINRHSHRGPTPVPKLKEGQKRMIAERKERFKHEKAMSIKKVK